MAEIISLRGKLAPLASQKTALAEALKDLTEQFPDSEKGVILLWDEKAKDWVVWSQITSEEMAYISLHLGMIAIS